MDETNFRYFVQFNNKILIGRELILSMDWKLFYLIASEFLKFGLFILGMSRIPLLKSNFYNFFRFNSLGHKVGDSVQLL